MNKTLMTIDFDIIMGPCILFYNHLVPQSKWEDLNTYEIANSLHADYGIYFKLTSYLCNLLKKLKSDQIVFVTGHDQVLNFIDKNEKYNIINIDHHHDLGYGNNAQKGYELNCANWVKHMMDNNQCSSYMWVRNQDSDLIGGVDQTDVTSLCTDILLTMDTNLDGLATPDLLCIVTSPQWVPPKFLYLLDCWLTMCESFYGHEFELH